MEPTRTPNGTQVLKGVHTFSQNPGNVSKILKCLKAQVSGDPGHHGITAMKVSKLADGLNHLLGTLEQNMTTYERYIHPPTAPWWSSC